MANGYLAFEGPLRLIASQKDATIEKTVKLLLAKMGTSLETVGSFRSSLNGTLDHLCGHLLQHRPEHSSHRRVEHLVGEIDDIFVSSQGNTHAVEGGDGAGCI